MKVGLVQFCVGPDPKVNAKHLETLVSEAIGKGCTFVLTPEASNIIQPDRSALNRAVGSAEDDPVFQMAQRVAGQNKVFICLGSLLVQGGAAGKLVNRQILLDPSGAIINSYDKIHLFDVSIGDGQHYGESEIFSPGDEAILSALPDHPATLGHTICYDLRFPQLHQTLAMAGANVLLVPAAFTQKTGRAHWHTLLRARAIETGAWVLASGTCGEHAGERRTYGHSCIINPWGEIVAEIASETDEGLIVHELDFDQVTAARQAIPALENARTFNLPSSL